VWGLFVTLLAFGAKTPVNCTAKWFCSCTSDCEYFFDLTGTEGKDRSKTSIYRKFGCHLYLLQQDSPATELPEIDADHGKQTSSVLAADRDLRQAV